MLCMLKHYARSIYALVCFALQGNFNRLEETETVEVKYSGVGGGLAVWILLRLMEVVPLSPFVSLSE